MRGFVVPLRSVPRATRIACQNTPDEGCNVTQSLRRRCRCAVCQVHNTRYEAGGRTCLCNGGPKCRHDHRLKQHPGWRVEQLADGTFRWTTPSGRSYDTEPTRYPI
jgi:hypothetical protein